MNELKIEAYYDALKQAYVAVEMHLNHLSQINDNESIDERYLKKDFESTILSLELSLATLCILLRKMSENHMIEIPTDTRRDINSIIHSNRFDFDTTIIAYSRNGREEVDLDAILHLAKSYMK